MNKRLRGEIAKTHFHSQFFSYLPRVLIFVEPTVYIFFQGSTIRMDFGQYMRPFSLVHFPFSPGFGFLWHFLHCRRNICWFNIYIVILLANINKVLSKLTCDSLPTSVYEFMDLNYIYIIQTEKKIILIVEPCMCVNHSGCKMIGIIMMCVYISHLTRNGCGKHVLVWFLIKSRSCRRRPNKAPCRVLSIFVTTS